MYDYCYASAATSLRTSEDGSVVRPDVDTADCGGSSSTGASSMANEWMVQGFEMAAKRRSKLPEYARPVVTLPRTSASQGADSRSSADADRRTQSVSETKP
jgi:hypothetical protein